MAEYAVTEETVRLNAEVTELSGQVRWAQSDTEDLWREMRAMQIKYAKDMLERGTLEERLRAKEQELADAVGRRSQ